MICFTPKVSFSLDFSKFNYNRNGSWPNTTFVLFSVVSTAQTKTKKYDQLFDRYEYGSAAKPVELVEKEIKIEYIYKHLAESYFKIEKNTKRRNE
jgi:hypothetical protein